MHGLTDFLASPLPMMWRPGYSLSAADSACYNQAGSNSGFFNLWL